MKTIEITVFPTGQTAVETKGFEGANCRQASAFLEKALGPSLREQLTSEFYADEHTTLQTQERT